MCSRENKIFFLVPENKTIELKHRNQIRKSEPKSFLYLFSKIALIQHARHRTQRRRSIHAVRFYCSLCARAAHVITWPETRAFEDEPTKHGKRKETEVKMNFSFTLRQQLLFYHYFISITVVSHQYRLVQNERIE